MSSYSPNLAITLIDNGAQSGTWGNTTNTNLGTLIEQAISGYVEYACTGGTDTITIPNGATGVARNMYLELTGTGGGTLVVPTNKKLYFIYNNTDGSVTVKVSGQTGVTLATGVKTLLVSDGTDVSYAINNIPLTFTDIVASTVTATTGNITTGNITTGNITTGNITTGNITTGNITTGNITTLNIGGYTIVESGGKLVFKYGSTTIASMTSAGVFTALAEITSNTAP